MPAPITPGRVCLSLVAGVLGPGCFVADWSRTHVFNPRWPPHAKFHNGQTMAMGASLALGTLYYTWRVPGRHLHLHLKAGREGALLRDNDDGSTTDTDVDTKRELEKESIRIATLLGSLYFVTALAAWFFPGSLAVDPEFGTGFPQFPMFSGLLILAWVGGWLELTRLEGLDTKHGKKRI
ncbi:hypothetical protein PV08_05594 [Exophiala spinifera]|uniref:Uncharacterized protein n=1 Tax=Exophiala spinifera TaxID=91928 RepID=A0A0D1YKP0_9EURO|nr:uncharacterized protein PV08_05594 [Exophiala spinifera]KIW15546.1 hypothetical protein PV08_05594 [Exophiala spinifera]